MISFTEAARILNSDLPDELDNHSGSTMAAAYYLKAKAAGDILKVSGIPTDETKRICIPALEWNDLLVSPAGNSAHHIPGEVLTQQSFLHEESKAYLHLHWNKTDIESARSSFVIWLVESLIADPMTETVFREETQQWLRDNGSAEAVLEPVNLFPGGITWVDKNYDVRSGDAIRPANFGGKKEKYYLAPFTDVMMWFDSDPSTGRQCHGTKFPVAKKHIDREQANEFLARFAEVWPAHYGNPGREFVRDMIKDHFSWPRKIVRAFSKSPDCPDYWFDVGRKRTHAVTNVERDSLVIRAIELMKK